MGKTFFGDIPIKGRFRLYDHNWTKTTESIAVIDVYGHSHCITDDAQVEPIEEPTPKHELIIAEATKMFHEYIEEAYKWKKEKVSNINCDEPTCNELMWTNYGKAAVLSELLEKFGAKPEVKE